MVDNSVITSILSRSAAIKEAMARDEALCGEVARAAEAIRQSVKKGGTVYCCGNGGSACDAMHLTEELVARFKRERPGIRAMHFADPGTLTCWANDYAYDQVFERQASTFCTDKDVLIAFSTSGNSPNVLKAVAAAKERGSFTIALTGRDGGKLKGAVHLPIIVPAQETERIQEGHITIVHILCELIEQRM